MRASRRDARAARKLYRLCLVHGLLDESRVRTVVHGIIESRRRGGLAALTQFQRLVRMDRERHTAQVETAVALPEDLRTTVQTGVARMFGPGVTASFTEKAALIGGMRLQVGSEVYDGSVRARLAAIESRL
jgi:F-type H+-transporting ATPase subunit delta